MPTRAIGRSRRNAPAPGPRRGSGPPESPQAGPRTHASTLVAAAWPLGDRGFKTALDQTRGSDAFRTGREAAGGTSPPELLDVAEKSRVRSERRQVFEEKRQVPTIAQEVGREILEAAVPIQEPRRRDRTDSREPGVPVRCVTHEG